MAAREWGIPALTVRPEPACMHACISVVHVTHSALGTSRRLELPLLFRNMPNKAHMHLLLSLPVTE
jgi:hypothetical protein